MYHAQTINGSRFAEMRLHDYCLGSLILFHDFLIIYWLTLYWQVYARLAVDPIWDMLSTVALETNTNPKSIYLRDADYSGKLIHLFSIFFLNDSLRFVQKTLVSIRTKRGY